MSSPSQPSGISSTAQRRDSAFRCELGRGHHVDGQLDLEVERVLAAQLLGHLAADEHRVGPAAEVAQDAELVLDLRAAGDEHERPLDLAEQAAEMLELGEQQESGVGRQQVRDGLGRGVRAMRRAERVVDVEVAAVGELAREALVVRRLARVEARVLEHVDALVRQELSQPRRDRRHRVLRAVLLRLRPAEMRADAHLRRALLEQELERRQRGADAGVVGDAPVLERHVEVGADEHGLPRDVGVADGSRHPHYYAPTAAGSVAPIFATRSTRRQL